MTKVQRGGLYELPAKAEDMTQDDLSRLAQYFIEGYTADPWSTEERIQAMTLIVSEAEAKAAGYEKAIDTVEKLLNKSMKIDGHALERMDNAIAQAREANSAKRDCEVIYNDYMKHPEEMQSFLDEYHRMEETNFGEDDNDTHSSD